MNAATPDLESKILAAVSSGKVYSKSSLQKKLGLRTLKPIDEVFNKYNIIKVDNVFVLPDVTLTVDIPPASASSPASPTPAAPAPRYQLPNAPPPADLTKKVKPIAIYGGEPALSHEFIALMVQIIEDYRISTPDVPALLSILDTVVDGPLPGVVPQEVYAFLRYTDCRSNFYPGKGCHELRFPVDQSGVSVGHSIYLEFCEGGMADQYVK